MKGGNKMNWAAVLWLVMFVVFLLAEGATVALVSTWFAIGSLAAMLMALIGAGIALQVIVFVIISAVCLTALRPLVRKHIQPKLTKTNVDAVSGTTGLVTVAIDNVTAQGQVKLGAMEWTARSVSGEPIAVGTLVKVERVEGVKAIVSPVKESVNA
jgi:membrane protein implicated in regulation of membrane protease activity